MTETFLQEVGEEPRQSSRIKPYHETAVIPRDTMQFD